MTALKVLVVMGVLDSFDNNNATVEWSVLINGGPPMEAGMGIIPTSLFPCPLQEGQTFYILHPDGPYRMTIICDTGEGC